jgi:outer membrane protein assembly factor BamD
VTPLVHHYDKWILIFAIWVICAACSSTPNPAGTASQTEISPTDEQIFVGDSIEMNYDPNVIMKRAESFFEKESYAEAIVEYKHFLDLHRKHVLAPYAQYKIGVSHFKQYRTVDRDPDPLHQSIQHFEKLLQDFPKSRYEAEAKNSIRICKEQLAQRHLMVGKFYLRRESYLAAAHRFEKVIHEYPELESAGEAMFHLAKTYQDLGIEEWTQEWLIALVKGYPNNPYHSDGQKFLVELQEKNPTLVATMPTAPSEKTLTHTQQPSVAPTPPDQDAPLFSYAGKLPTIANTTSLHMPEQRESTPSPTSCTIGTWCDSRSASVSTLPTQYPHAAKTCQTGEWC